MAVPEIVEPHGLTDRVRDGGEPDAVTERVAPDGSAFGCGEDQPVRSGGMVVEVLVDDVGEPGRYRYGSAGGCGLGWPEAQVAADFSEGAPGSEGYPRATYLNAGRGCPGGCVDCGGAAESQLLTSARDGVLLYPTGKLIADAADAVSEGAEVLRSNLAAVDAALDNLHEVRVPTQSNGTGDLASPVPGNAPEFVREVTAKMIARQGDLIPVSALLLGTMILGERVDARHLWGMALIGLGLAAIDGRLIMSLRARFLRPGLEQ